MAACTVSSTTNVSFGTAYNPLSGTPTEAQGTVTISCGDGTTSITSVALNVGTGGGSFASRTMAQGGHTVAYNLYTTNAYAAVWGDGTGGSVTVGGGRDCHTPNPCTFTAYGRIPGSQTTVIPSATPYTSTITATVTW